MRATYSCKAENASKISEKHQNALRFGLTDARICYIMERVKFSSLSKFVRRRALSILSGGFHG